MLGGPGIHLSSFSGNIGSIHIIPGSRNQINESHTGDTAAFLLSYNIPIDTRSDTFGVNDQLGFLIKRTVVASATNRILRVYIGPTSGTLVGASQIIELNTVTAGTARTPGKRTLFFNGALTTLNGISLATSTTTSDEINNNNNWSNFTVPDFNGSLGTLYVMFVMQNGAIGDSQTLDSVQLIHFKN